MAGKPPLVDTLAKWMAIVVPLAAGIWALFTYWHPSGERAAADAASVASASASAAPARPGAVTVAASDAAIAANAPITNSTISVSKDK